MWHGEDSTNVWAGTAQRKQMDMSVHIQETIPLSLLEARTLNVTVQTTIDSELASV